MLRSIATILILFVQAYAGADPINCNLEKFIPKEGLKAEVKDESLIISWTGDNQSKLKLTFIISDGTPLIRELSIQSSTGDWDILTSDIKPVFKIASGIRRVTQQQTRPLEGLGVELTAEILDKVKWDAFWDAPLYTTDEPPRNHQGSIPAADPFANHPGMPRSPEEVTRVTASYQVKGCEVRTNGSRLEIIFDGVNAGPFEGHLQYDIFRGSNLIRQTLIAKTQQKSLAFKYDAGWQGLEVNKYSSIVWKDLANNLQDYKFGSPVQLSPTILKSNNRLIAAQLKSGSIAMFPPPHSFYWARESEQNLGYSWYQKASESTFSLGIRQAEHEEDPEFYHNFALYNARPDEWQRMPLFIYISPGSGNDAIQSALEFTRGDQFKPLPNYKVMGAHYHVGLVARLKEKGSPNYKLNDIETMKSIGVNIYGVIDGVRGAARHNRGEPYLNELHEYYEAARHQSDVDFLVMPNDENSTGSRPPFIGGHYDIMISKPLYWKPGREDGVPLKEDHPKFGTVYNLGSAEDLMAMTESENAIISMPHPRSKGSTGYPDSIKHMPHFMHENYFGLGYRWGMGIDGSEKRLGESRFLPLWDETSNWMAAQGKTPKFALAISEARSDIGDRGKPPFDDTYGMSPVNYLKLDTIPTVDDMSSIIDVLKKGEYFVTSGEVLIPSFKLKGEGIKRVIEAKVEWTFPLEFVEVVWGDGNQTDRQIISTTDFDAFGHHTFKIPFNTKNKKWIRFAAWDVAANGALIQPIDLTK